MNTMESVGNGPSAVGKPDAQPLSLEANAETLALFAGLFALIQPDQTGDATNSEGIATDQPSPDTGSAAGAAMTIPAHAIPAAAKLFADSKIQADPQAGMQADSLSGALAGDLPVGAKSDGDVTALVRLLLAAQEIAPTNPQQGAQQPGMTGADAISGIDAGPEGQSRTAAEMLSGALEILKSLEAATTTNAAGASSEAASQVASADVVGPLPAASADFVGPMPAADLPTAQMPHATVPHAVAVLAPSSPDFVGPMPAATLQALPTASQANSQVNSQVPSQAMGPWPAVALVPAKADFIGPMPAPTLTSTSTSTSVAAVPAGPAIETVLVKEGGQQVVKSLDQMAAQLADQKLEQKAMVKDAAASTTKAVLQAQNAVSGGAAQISAASSAAASSAYGSAELANQASSQTSSQTGNQTGSQTAPAQAGGQSNGHNGGQNSGQGNAQSNAQHAMDASQSRGSADRTLLHRLNTDQAGWSESMVRRLTSDLRAGIQTVRIVLEPRHLGRLNVELGLRDGKASIRIAAETAEAAKLLSGARGQLGQMFESAGMRLAGFQASNAGADLGGHAGQGQDGQAGGENAGGNKDFANKMGAATGNAQDADRANAEAELQPRAGETAVLSILA